VLSTGAVDCWGNNIDGELGNGTTGGPDGGLNYDTPQAVTGLTDAVSLTSENHGSYCAVLSTGGVNCWGENEFGQLGNGTTGGPDGGVNYGEPGYDSPQAVKGITDAVSLTSDSQGSYCAVLSTGAVKCWGYNYYGEVGHGTTGGPDGAGGYDRPRAVTGITDAVSLSSDGRLDESYCAVLSTGAVNCWGDNGSGELGNGTTGGPDGEDGYDTPQAVTGLTDAVSVSSDGGASYCALLSTGAADCWGYNDGGELGNGTTGGPDGAHGDDTPTAVSAG
jgi:alpha-tubulin suppressor-like RCC1 family protein